MNDLLSGLLGGVTPQISNQLSSKFGIDQSTASQLLPAIAPLILGGLKRQADNNGGQQRVEHILNKYGNENVLNDVSGTIQQNSLNANPDPDLGGLLGGSGTQAAQALSNKFGIDSGTAMKLIPILAPFILGALSKHKNSPAGQSGHTSRGGLMDFLDQNGDGSVLDDVMGFLGGTRSGGSQQQSGGGLGGMLGNILGGGR